MLDWLHSLLQVLVYPAQNCLTTRTPGTAFSRENLAPESFAPDSFSDLNILTPQFCFTMGNHVLEGWATSNETHSGDALRSRTYVMKAGLLLSWDESSLTDVPIGHVCFCSISHVASHPVPLSPCAACKAASVCSEQRT